MAIQQPETPYLQIIRRTLWLLLAVTLLAGCEKTEERAGLTTTQDEVVLRSTAGSEAAFTVSSTRSVVAHHDGRRVRRLPHPRRPRGDDGNGEGTGRQHDDPAQGAGQHGAAPVVRGRPRPRSRWCRAGRRTPDGRHVPALVREPVHAFPPKHRGREESRGGEYPPGQPPCGIPANEHHQGVAARTVLRQRGVPRNGSCAHTKTST